MSLNIYNFDNYSGIARCDKQGKWEWRIYLKGKTNVELAICTKQGDRYNLYNFICDKDHMKNMWDMNWFGEINEIDLYIKKVDTFLKKFIEYAIKYHVKINLIPLPF